MVKTLQNKKLLQELSRLNEGASYLSYCQESIKLRGNIVTKVTWEPTLLFYIVNDVGTWSKIGSTLIIGYF